MTPSHIARELRRHSPFTAVGALSGAVVMVLVAVLHVPQTTSTVLFWSLHPLHVLLSALVTAAMYRRHSHGRLGWTLLVGYVGSVGVATLSDSVIPFVGEWLLQIPNRGIHLGFIEKWWLVNPLAALGILIGYVWPHTRVPHAGHVFLSTWASLFHMTMAMDGSPDPILGALIVVFLFLAVWIPCCTSDIVLPLMFEKRDDH
ncbi:hypothetical protein JXA88_01510 [Candidatus Fermentibacteria bacterium]|nr:hypothetical protein [Candidatus Fermentibacteria bacterium]